MSTGYGSGRKDATLKQNGTFQLQVHFSFFPFHSIWAASLLSGPVVTRVGLTLLGLLDFVQLSPETHHGYNQKCPLPNRHFST